jgi:DNA-binding NarL/FixJ family response regulator
MHDGRRISVTRVLVVEDHDLFRGYIRSALETRQDFSVVGEAVDGPEAVGKCLELQPDVVLMDVGLPGLSGIEAARRIRAMVPSCRIVFLTQESSVEVVHEAIRLGAAGYVVKVHAASDLVPALIAAREGRLFVSSAVEGSRNYLAAGKARNKVDTLPLARLGAAYSHKVHFYLDGSSFVSGLASFIGGALNSGKVVLAIASERHCGEILHALQQGGIDADLAVKEERLFLQDVAEVLAQFMVDDLPDRTRFFVVAREIMDAIKAANPGSRICACGECAPALWMQGNGDGALQLERLWDQIAREYDVEVLCVYIVDTLREHERRIYEDICALHSVVSAD